MATVDIIIRMIDQTGAASSKTVASLKNMATQAAAVGAAALAVAAGLKKVYDLGAEGAQLEFTASKFDRLTESIGTTSEALLKDLKDATGGIYSDMELMASATDLVGLGLAKTHEEAVRLAKVSGGLNMNMNQLVLTLTNMTTMRFDALGVSVDGFKERVDELKKSGMSADAAFKEAFLQQAEMQLEKVGHAADNSLGSFKRLEAQFKNLGDSAKRNLGEALAPVADSLADFMETNARAQDKMQIGIELWEKQNNQLILSRAQFNMNRDAIEELANSYMGAVAGGERYAAMAEMFADSTGEIVLSAEEQQKAFEALSESNQKYLDLVGTLTDQQRDYAEEINDINAKRKEIETDMQTALAQGWDATSEKVLEYKDKLTELDEKEAETTAKMELESKKRILAMLEQKLAVDGLSDAEMNYLLETGLQWGIYSESAVTEAQKAIDKAKELEDKFLSLPSDHYMTIHVQTAGGMGTFTEGELAMRGRSAGVKQHAAGGDFMIPMSYGNEGFKLGNGDTASGGERVTITPRGGKQQDSSMALAAMLAASIPSARDNAKALARELMKLGVGTR